MVWNADPDLDAGSVVQRFTGFRDSCTGTFLRYQGEGGLADPDLRAWICISSFKPRTVPFKTLKILKGRGKSVKILSKDRSKYFPKAA